MAGEKMNMDLCQRDPTLEIQLGPSLIELKGI